MVTNLSHVRQSVHDCDQEDFTLADFPNCLYKIDDRLLEPEIAQSCFFARPLRGTHLSRADYFRLRVEYWRATANLQVFDPAEVDLLEQFY
jgi:hypothetical protein